MSIETNRREIDRIDGQIVRLLADRIKFAREIGREKKKLGKRITDNTREKQVLEHIKNLAAGENLSPEDAETIYRLIIAATKGSEGHPVVTPEEIISGKAGKGNGTKVAIIGGSGKMGQWVAARLREEGKRVVITGRDRRKLLAAGKQLGVKTATNIAAVKQADVVVISVTIGSFAGVAAEIAPYVRPGQVIVDITSVKTMPVDIMHMYFKKAEVLGTHPLFGPGAKNVANMNFVLTPTNKRESALAQKVTAYLEARSARVTLMTPQEHDGMMKVILGLAHYIALVSADTLAGLKNIRQMAAISGITYKVLLTLIESVISEDPELYATLQMALPGLPELEDEFRKKAKFWAELAKNQDKAQFIRRMNAVHKKLEKNSVDFGKAYANMYKLVEGLK
ncbi:MAG: prephenate dehydrogenase [Dehalococcoidales bacterium]|nr:prephenate dehydrogenase [Dehalococcoidales bacterium]